MYPRSSVASIPFDDLLRVSNELKNVEPGIGAVDDVDVPAVIGGDIVCLDHPNTDVRITLVWPTTKIGVGGDGRDKVRHIHRVIWVADVKSPHTSVEVRD